MIPLLAFYPSFIQLGASMKELLDTCTYLGTEALVEVHTVAELEKALDLGATNIVATNWDRIENTLYPDQAKGLKYMIPDLIVSIAAGDGKAHNIRASLPFGRFLPSIYILYLSSFFFLTPQQQAG